MADVEITLPSLGDEAGDAAEVSFWYADVGKQVKAGDHLLQVVTDKATFDVPCEHSGTVKEHKAGEGDPVKVGQVLCILETGD